MISNIFKRGQRKATTTTAESMGALMRQLEQGMGSSRMAETVLRSISQAAEHLDAETWDQFFDELAFLIEDIEQTRPRFSIVIDGVYDVYERCKKLRDQGVPFNKDIVPAFLQPVIASIHRDQHIMAVHAASLLKDGDVVLIQDLSSTIMHLLQCAKAEGKDITVIVAKQDFAKTALNIRKLHEIGIRFRVVPTYMLSSIDEHISCVLVGALTLNCHERVVTAPGVVQLISEFAMHGVPSYLFLQTSKFSLWEDGDKQRDIHIRERTITLEDSDIDYQYVTYSHDRVDIRHFTKVITEKGVITPEETLKLYAELLKSRKKQQAAVEDIIEEVEGAPHEEDHQELIAEDAQHEAAEPLRYEDTNVTIAEAQQTDPDDLPEVDEPGHTSHRH